MEVPVVAFISFLLFHLQLPMIGSEELSNRVDLDTRIVGGEEIDIIYLPYQIALLNSVNRGTSLQISLFCGGSIIHRNFVLTAAHCTAGKSKKSIMIRAGSSYWHRGGVLKNIEKIIQHPKYQNNLNGAVPDYDFSLLKLKGSLQYSKFIKPARLPEHNEKIYNGTNAVISGWGITSEDDPSSSPRELQAANVRVVDYKTCRSAYGNKLTGRMFCAGLTSGGVDTCQGDSGGGLVSVSGESDGTIIGVVSWGQGCGRENYPGVNAYVGAVREWIDESMQN